MSPIKDSIIGNLKVGPVSTSFQEEEWERDGRPIAAAHEIEQSIIAMGDQFQLNYIHSLLLSPSVVLSPAAGKVLLILERCSDNYVFLMVNLSSHCLGIFNGNVGSSAALKALQGWSLFLFSKLVCQAQMFTWDIYIDSMAQDLQIEINNMPIKHWCEFLTLGENTLPLLLQAKISRKTCRLERVML